MLSITAPTHILGHYISMIFMYLSVASQILTITMDQSWLDLTPA